MIKRAPVLDTSAKALKELASEHDAMVESDGGGFRCRARLLQSLWRQHRGFPAGYHRKKLLGSDLEVAWAERTFGNFLTPTIKAVVQHTLRSASEVAESERPLFASPRIYNSLLSSQPLCFNLFGELSQNLPFATSFLARLLPGKAREVTRIVFEYSPGRGDSRFTDDRSAFDVFIEYRRQDGAPGFLGIEVKYHEHMKDAVAKHRSRYDELARKMGCFKKASIDALKEAPLQQIWRDHLLAGAMIDSEHTPLRYREGCFVMLAPADNSYCQAAISQYRHCLSDSTSFDSWTLEQVVDSLRRCSTASWVQDFFERYLDFGEIDELLEKRTRNQQET